MSTTAKRKKHRKGNLLRRPFDLKLMRRAKAIASRYQITLWRQDDHWFGVGVEEPGTYGDGRTIGQAVREVREALAVTVACHLETGEPVIEPIIDQEQGRKRAD